MMYDALPSIFDMTYEAMKVVFPVRFNFEQMEFMEHYIHSEGIGVLIGLTHDVHGRLIIEGQMPVFQALSKMMYGMELKYSMLESFVGEIGNMVAGNMSTWLAENGVHVEISPPTVIVGPTKLAGFTTATRIPVNFMNIGRIYVILILDEQ